MSKRHRGRVDEYSDWSMRDRRRCARRLRDLHDEWTEPENDPYSAEGQDAILMERRIEERERRRDFPEE